MYSDSPSQFERYSPPYAISNSILEVVCIFFKWDYFLLTEQLGNNQHHLVRVNVVFYSHITWTLSLRVHVDLAIHSSWKNEVNSTFFFFSYRLLYSFSSHFATFQDYKQQIHRLCNVWMMIQCFPKKWFIIIPFTGIA